MSVSVPAGNRWLTPTKQCKGYRKKGIDTEMSVGFRGTIKERYPKTKNTRPFHP